MHCKQHLKKQYKGYQIDVYLGMNAHWFAFIPNRVKYIYKTAEMKSRESVIRDCRDYIDRYLSPL